MWIIEEQITDEREVHPKTRKELAYFLCDGNINTILGLQGHDIQYIKGARYGYFIIIKKYMRNPIILRNLSIDDVLDYFFPEPEKFLINRTIK